MKVISTKSFRDWSSLPGEILILIAGKIVSADDYVWFGAACRSWYLAAADFHDDKKPRFTPLFMSGTNPDSGDLPFRNPASNCAFTLRWIDADTKASMFVEPALHSPEAPYRIWGSPFGWLILHERNSRGLCLLNPFTGSTIPLPSLPIRFVEDKFKAFLTASPESDPNDCLVILVQCHKRFNADLYLHRAFGDGKVWSSTRVSRGVADVAFFKGNLFAIEPYSEFRMSLYLFDPRRDLCRCYSHRGLEMILSVMPHNNHMGPHIVTQEHLFELNGELCLCLRFYNWSNRSVTSEFKIFKIDLFAISLAPLLSLGDHCLFWGNNYSFARKASYPRDKVFERDGYAG